MAAMALFYWHRSPNSLPYGEFSFGDQISQGWLAAQRAYSVWWATYCSQNPVFSPCIAMLPGLSSSVITQSPSVIYYLKKESSWMVLITIHDIR
jgi:hypothetical protein